MSEDSPKITFHAKITASMVAAVVAASGTGVTLYMDMDRRLTRTEARLAAINGSVADIRDDIQRINDKLDYMLNLIYGREYPFGNGLRRAPTE